MRTLQQFLDGIENGEVQAEAAMTILRHLRSLSQHEETFALVWRALAEDAPAPEREYEFHTFQKYRFDFAWPAQRVAVEIDGGQWAPYGGRHSRDSDRWKLNAAAVEGWRVLRYSESMLEDPARVVNEVRAALGLEVSDG